MVLVHGTPRHPAQQSTTTVPCLAPGQRRGLQDTLEARNSGPDSQGTCCSYVLSHTHFGLRMETCGLAGYTLEVGNPIQHWELRPPADQRAWASELRTGHSG